MSKSSSQRLYAQEYEHGAIMSTLSSVAVIIWISYNRGEHKRTSNMYIEDNPPYTWSQDCAIYFDVLYALAVRFKIGFR